MPTPKGVGIYLYEAYSKDYIFSIANLFFGFLNLERRKLSG